MKLVVDKASLVSVADAIRTKGNTTDDLEFPQGFVDAVNAIESGGGGGTEEIENIIDESGVLESTEGTITEKVEQLIDKAYDQSMLYILSKKLNFNNNNTFNSEVWAFNTIPKIDFSLMTGFSYSFSYSVIEYIDYYINSEKGTNFSSAFASTKKLKWMVGIDLSSADNIRDIFAGSAIETIYEPLNLSKVTNTYYAFDGALSLKDIRFVFETIKVSVAFGSTFLSIGNVFDLTDTENVGSVQSIINGLATLAEGAAAQTLTLSKNLPLTAEQKQAITTAVNNKGWTLAFA